MATKQFKKFARCILRAQAASDAGKGYESYSHNSKACWGQGYALKDQYIAEAIHYARGLKGVKYYHDTQERVILFNIAGYGQVSFHTFASWKSLSKDNLQVIKWNKFHGGSLKTCHRLATKLNLYNEYSLLKKGGAK